MAIDNLAIENKFLSEKYFIKILLFSYAYISKQSAFCDASFIDDTLNDRYVVLYNILYLHECKKDRSLTRKG